MEEMNGTGRLALEQLEQNAEAGIEIDSGFVGDECRNQFENSSGTDRLSLIRWRRNKPPRFELLSEQALVLGRSEGETIEQKRSFLVAMSRQGSAEKEKFGGVVA